MEDSRASPHFRHVLERTTRRPESVLGSFEKFPDYEGLLRVNGSLENEQVTTLDRAVLQNNLMSAILRTLFILSTAYVVLHN